MYVYFYFAQDIHLLQEELKLREQKCKEKKKKTVLILWQSIWGQSKEMILNLK